jgi:hypothetical protein
MNKMERERERDWMSYGQRKGRKREKETNAISKQ